MAPNNGVNSVSAPSSILAAAIGLTSLGAPSPPSKSSPGPSDAASGGSRAPHGHGSLQPKFINDTMVEPPRAPAKWAVAKRPTAGIAMEPPTLTTRRTSPPPLACSLNLNNLPAIHSASQAGAAQHLRSADRSSLWSHGALPSFTSCHPPVPTAMSMNMERNFAADRLAAIDRSSVVTARQSLYGSYCPYAHSQSLGLMLPPLPTPHQITPVPNTKNFPETLFEVITSEENAHIISWLPHGQGFIIHDKQRFASILLPRYFDGAKFTSFTRRLKRWNFVRVPRGPELGAYYNKHFIRDKPELVQEMRYRMDGQFHEAKDKSENTQECSESENTPGEQVKTKMEAKLQQKEKVNVNISPRLTSKEESKLQIQPASSQTKIKYPSDAQYCHPMKPSSAFPQRPKPAAVHSNMSHTRASSAPNSKALRSHPTSTLDDSSSEELALGDTINLPADLCCCYDTDNSRGEIMDETVRDMHMRLMPPFVNLHERLSVQPERGDIALPLSCYQANPGIDQLQVRESHGGGRQPGIMNQEEEKEFAEYLSMKREIMNRRKWSERY